MPSRFQEDKGLERMLVGDILQGRDGSALTASPLQMSSEAAVPAVYLLRQRETCTPKYADLHAMAPNDACTP